MNKKYQVFISSTFIDLKEERKAVVDILLKTDCIPAGMELFTATDDDQFNVIKSIIDLCDYYILIIGNRYGSINETTKVSYTEMEYNYAVEKNIPILVFDVSKFSEEDKDNETMLKIFKRKAMDSRLASICTDVNVLKTEVMGSIWKAKEKSPRNGWVRGGALSDEKLKDDLILLQRERTELIAENQMLKNINVDILDNNDLIFYDEEVIIKATNGYGNLIRGNIKFRFDLVFKKIALIFPDCFSDYDLYQYLDKYLKKNDRYQSDIEITEDYKIKILNQYLALGLIGKYEESSLLYFTTQGKHIASKMTLFYKTDIMT